MKNEGSNGFLQIITCAPRTKAVVKKLLVLSSNLYCTYISTCYSKPEVY